MLRQEYGVVFYPKSEVLESCVKASVDSQGFVWQRFKNHLLESRAVGEQLVIIID